MYYHLSYDQFIHHITSVHYTTTVSDKENVSEITLFIDTQILKSYQYLLAITYAFSFKKKFP